MENVHPTLTHQHPAHHVEGRQGGDAVELRHPLRHPRPRGCPDRSPRNKPFALPTENTDLQHLSKNRSLETDTTVTSVTPEAVLDPTGSRPYRSLWGHPSPTTSFHVNPKHKQKKALKIEHRHDNCDGEMVTFDRFDK